MSGTPQPQEASDVLLRQGGFAERDRWSAAGWCRMERALDLIGTRSAMLVLREMFFGGTKFDELARRTGFSEAVIAGRLKELHTHGIVARRPYQAQGQRTRDEYVLTPRGRSLFPLVVALTQWGEEISTEHRTGVELVHRDCGAALEAEVVCGNGHRVPLEQAAVRLRDENELDG